MTFNHPLVAIPIDSIHRIHLTRYNEKTWKTYMRPHPEDGMEPGLLVAVDGLVAWGKVLVFKQLPAIWVGQKYNQKYTIQIQQLRRQSS